MREKIQNYLKITCNDVDLTTLTDIEFYVKQFGFFAVYRPSVTAAHEMVVQIPFADAMKLKPGKASLQFAFTYPDGTPDASNVVEKNVQDLLKEVGYGLV